MSSRNNLPSRADKENVPALHDSGLKAGSLIDASISRLTKDQAQALIAKAGEEALRLEAKAREQNLDYVVGKKAVEDHIDTFSMLDKNGHATRHKVLSEIKTGAGNMRIESKSGATCFVASVAYENPNHPDVMFLRGFRDEILRSTSLGRAFISIYFHAGPVIARVVDKSKFLRNYSRKAISKIVASLRKRYLDKHW